MEELGKEMTKYYGGLSLAVVVLGGLLATKHTFYEWEMGHRNVESCLRGKGNEQEGKGVSDLLALSFLSLGHFPEDYELNTS